MPVYINKIGTYLPKKILSNSDLEKMVETSDEWITSRTGIQERRIAEEEEATSDLGVKAVQDLFLKEEIDPLSIDLILVATSTPDYLMPSTAAIIQSKIGAKNAVAFDVFAACAGFLYGLSVAKAYVLSGLYKNILLIASEKMSAFMDYTDRNTCVLFGDGAAAAFISDKPQGLLVENVLLETDGDLSSLIIIPAGGSREPLTEKNIGERGNFLKMQGREVFKHAVRRMAKIATDSLEKEGAKIEEIAFIVPHQANERILDALANQFNYPKEKVFKTLHKYGNISAPGVLVALSELLEEKNLQKEERLLLLAFGSGLTYGASLLKKVS